MVSNSDHGNDCDPGGKIVGSKCCFAGTIPSAVDHSRVVRSPEGKRLTGAVSVAGAIGKRLTHTGIVSNPVCFFPGPAKTNLSVLRMTAAFDTIEARSDLRVFAAGLCCKVPVGT